MYRGVGTPNESAGHSSNYGITLVKEFRFVERRKLMSIFRLFAILTAIVIFVPVAFGQNNLGNWSSNPYSPNSTANPYGAGSTYNPNSVTNPYGRYGSTFSPYSATNPYATNSPKLFDSQGNYRGNLSTNQYDPNSVSNPYGRYGSPYSPDSVNNPYGAGSPYSPDSPTNPYGSGLTIFGQ